MLMAVIFDSENTNKHELINEVHQVWSDIYHTSGLRLGLSTESLRFSATLNAADCPSRPLGQEDAARQLLGQSAGGAREVIKTSKWIKSVTKAVDSLVKDENRNAVTRIGHARLVAVSVNLRSDLAKSEKSEILRCWENVSFRMYGMYGKDARTGVGEYVRLAWRIRNERLSPKEITQGLREIGHRYPAKEAIKHLREADCYNGWYEELRYIFYRYEEYLSRKKGQNFDNEQWARVWEVSAADSIEHIMPQGSKRSYIHWLGNLMILPPKLNSSLQDRRPGKKTEEYTNTGLLSAAEVASTIIGGGRWGKREIKEREEGLLQWAVSEWKD